MPKLAEKTLKNIADEGRRFFRFYNNENPMSEYGHAMFREAKNPYDAERLVGHYGKNIFELDGQPAGYPDASSLMGDIRRKIASSFRDGTIPGHIENTLRDGSKMRDVVSQFNPEDIVISAQAYDDPDSMTWFYNNIIEPMGYRGVKTNDGAISFYPEDIRKVSHKKDGVLPSGLKSALPYAIAGGGLMSAVAPSDADAIEGIRQKDAPLQDAWNPVEAFVGGLGGGIPSALAGVPIDGLMDFIMGRILGNGE